MALRGCGHPRVLVMPVDAAPVHPEDLQALLTSEAPAALSWQGCPGHPVVVPCEVVRPPSPLNQLSFQLVPARSADVLVDLDTPEDWAAFSRRSG